jgi:GT2 family glycosyltransferase
MKIGIGITNWNELAYLKQCIESLKYFKYPYNLYVWDNGSEDGSVDYLKTLPYGSVLFNNINAGMTVPWNWQLKEAFNDSDVKYCFICNNDILFNDTINKIIPFMEDNPEYGLICPAILPKMDDTNAIPYAVQLFQLVYNGKLDVGGLAGPCMIIPRTTFEKVGYFDEELTNSYNDMDYHQRVIKAGMKTVVYFNSVIWHKSGVSTGKNPDCHNKEYYNLFQRKHG